ncbi:hypothetical protein ABPG74_004121 [Tetrahymena malaccensis]
MEKNANKYYKILIDPQNSIDYYFNYVHYNAHQDNICLYFPKNQSFQQVINILQKIGYELQNVTNLKLEILNQFSPEQQFSLLQFFTQFSYLQSFCLDLNRCKQIFNFEHLFQLPINSLKKLSIDIQSCEINDQIILDLSSFIQKIKGLENLDLRITENFTLNEHTLEQFFLGLTELRNLEQIKIKIHSLSSLNLQKQFIETLKVNQKLKNLDLIFYQKQSIHEEISQNLFFYLREMVLMENLKLDFQSLYGDENRYDNIGYSFQNMNQLKYLELNISQQVSSICLDGIGESLANLQSIKALKLSLLTNYTYVDTFYKGINSLCNLEQLILQIRKRDLQNKILQEQSQLQKEVACIQNLSQLRIFELQLNSLTVHQINISTELINIFQSAQNLSQVSFDFNYRISDELCVIAQALNCLKNLNSFKINFMIQTNIKEEKIIQFLELIGQIASLEVLELRIFKIQNIHLLYFSKGFKFLFCLQKFVFYLSTSIQDEYIEDLFRDIKYLVNLKELVLNVAPNSFSLEASKILSDSLKELKLIQNITLGIVISEIIALQSVKNISDGLKNHRNLRILNVHLFDDFNNELYNNQLKNKREKLFQKHLLRLVTCKFL